MKNLAYFYPEGFFHIFNRTNNKEILFKVDSDYHYFLFQYQHYLSPFFKTYAYALLPNHFHFCISVRRIEQIQKYLYKLHPRLRTKTINKYLIQDSNERDVNELLVHQFSRFYNSYAKSINSSFNRKGNLFNRPFKRVHIQSDAIFGYIIYYIHHNARKHNIVQAFEDYEWQSYPIISGQEVTFLQRDYVINWFGGKDKYIEFHKGFYLEKDIKSFFF